MMRQINYKDPAAFFSKLNKLLRPNRSLKIENPTLDINSDPITSNLVDHSRAIIDLTKNSITIKDSVVKLNVIGAHYEKINSSRYLNNGTALKR